LKKMSKKLVLVIFLLISTIPILPLVSAKNVSIERIMVKTKVKLTPQVIQELSKLSKNINFVFEEINVVALSVPSSNVKKIRDLEIVETVEKDRRLRAVGYGTPTWNLDLINVAEISTSTRTVDYDGTGIYVAVLDTGLVRHWREYFPEESIATQYAKAFLNKQGKEVPSHFWERDTNSHGTHVTSTILGYYDKRSGTQYDGVAPGVKVIPVKVLNNNGFGWDSAVIMGIMYIAELSKMLGERIIINMSLGGPTYSSIEHLAIQWLLSEYSNIVIVAAAGNSGAAGMDYPGAYPEVISVGACGWTQEWIPDLTWWFTQDVTDPIDTQELYISPFSSRALTGLTGVPDQDLDVVAPGSWVVGPFMPFGVAHPDTPPWANNMPGEYFFVGGTSMATPHVSGIVALMMEVDMNLPSNEIEGILEGTSLPIGGGNAWVINPFTGQLEEVLWGTDATGSGIVQAEEAIDISNW
jgi:subtilisin family serine protease